MRKYAYEPKPIFDLEDAGRPMRLELIWGEIQKLHHLVKNSGVQIRWRRNRDDILIMSKDANGGTQTRKFSVGQAYLGMLIYFLEVTVIPRAELTVEAAAQLPQGRSIIDVTIPTMDRWVAQALADEGVCKRQIEDTVISYLSHKYHIPEAELHHITTLIFEEDESVGTDQ